MHLKKKERYDLKYGIYDKKLAISSIVLLYDIRCKKVISSKLSFKWLELYRIYNTVKGKGIYIPQELDRLQLAGTFTDNRLKKISPPLTTPARPFLKPGI